MKAVLCSVLVWMGSHALGADTLDIADGWKFRTDPRHAGLTGRWDGVSFNDAGWAVTDTRGPWEERGAPRFDGTAWYRKWVDVPATWTRVALVMPPPLDRADLFVNGTLVARDLAQPIVGTRRIVRDCTAALGPASPPGVLRPPDAGQGRRAQAAGHTRLLLALRVTNSRRHQPGGFSAEQEAPLALVSSIRPLLATRELWAASLAADWPAGPWPAWLRGEGATWTAIGDPRGHGVGFVGGRGQLVSPERDFAVTCWLVDHTAKKFFAMESLPATLVLEDHLLPMPVVRARAGRFNLMVQAWADQPEGAPGTVVGLGAATVENASDRTRDVDLVVAVTPFSPLGTLCDISTIGFDRALQAVLVNGRPAVIFGGAPDVFAAGAAGEDGSIARALLQGVALSASSVDDPEQRLASAAGIYHLRIQPYGSRTLTYRIFLAGRPEVLDPVLVQRVRDIGHKSSWKETKIRWQRLVAGKDRPVVRLSDRDKNVQHAFYAAMGHLLTAIAGDRLAPADRPAAAGALRRTGHAELAAALSGATVWHPIGPPVAVSATDTMVARLEAAERAMVAGDGEPAGRAIAVCLGHPKSQAGEAWATQTDAVVWTNTTAPVAGQWVGGGLPDPRVAAAFVRLVRDSLLHEADGALWLASAIPEEWVRPGKLVEIRWAPTAWGVFPGYALVASPRGLTLRRLKSGGAGVRGRGPSLRPEDIAHPPAGYRWRVPGTRKIKQAAVDGGRLRDVPPDRVLILPEDFRQASVTW